MNTLDVRRHADLFKPHEFNTPIHVIGAGATGSWLVLQLAKLGITDITVWDFDVVESHNIANQMYGIEYIGLKKVDALAHMIWTQTGTTIKTEDVAFTDQRLNGVVFMMTDTMSSRKQIWNDRIKMNRNVKILVEPRMGLSVGRVYNVDPSIISQCRAYEDTFYGDEEAEVSACGTSVSVVTTAMHIASICARQLINWHNNEELDNEILLDMIYNNIITSKWG